MTILQTIRVEHNGAEYEFDFYKNVRGEINSDSYKILKNGSRKMLVGISPKWEPAWTKAIRQFMAN